MKTKVNIQEKVQEAAGKLVEAYDCLREALAEATSVEFFILMKLIEKMNSLRLDTQHLASAMKDDQDKEGE